MTKPLHDIACQKIAEFVQNGSYDNREFELDSKSSNIVYSYLMNRDKPFNLKTIHKLNVTKVTLHPQTLDENTARQLKQFSLKELKIGNFSKSKSWCIFRRKETRHVDIVRILEAVLNEETRKNLQYLHIEKDQKLMKRWTAKIGNMLPSLTHLTMSDVHINEDDFYQLFGNFSNLRSLDISGTNILNIAGISRLKQLEVLALRDFSIATYTELKDLFNLKHLRVLDVSQTRFNLHSRNNIVEQFTECKMELPELRFMDCTRTSLSGDILECLLKTQRNLQLVTTIMTEAETSQYNDVRVLNTAYFHKSVQALVYCLTARKEFDSGYCMKAIRISISEDNLQNLNIPSCIKTIVKSMQTFDSISVTQNGLKCLIIFGMLYSNQLCSNGVTLLVEALMSFVYLYKRMISEAYVKVNISYWNAVEKLVNLKLGKLDFDKISKTAMSFLLENRVSKALRTRASSVLCQCIHRMHSDELKSLSEKTENVNRLVDILEWSVGQKNETKLSEFFEITIKMTEKSSKACTNMIQAGIISISLSCMEKVESNDITTKCLELLTNLSSALNYDSLQELYTSSNVDKIGLMLTRQKNDITFQTTSLLTKLLHHAEGNQVQYKLINQLLAESNRLAIGIDKIHI